MTRMDAERVDICVIGAGSAGLSVAAGAAQLGARTVLIEAHRMGGDCLNTGCVPSKSLLATARLAQQARQAAAFGGFPAPPGFEFARVCDRVHGVIAAIAPHDSEQRFAGLGCRVVRGRARFVDHRTVAAGGRTFRARRIVIATGSRPRVPAIAGLDQVPYFTNETVFNNSVLPDHLVVIGGGPIGVEMAQAHRRLGAAVTVLARYALPPRDDPQAVQVLRQALADEGVAICEFAAGMRIGRNGHRIAVGFTGQDGARRDIDASHLLVAAGRRPNIEDLDLGVAGVRHSAACIEVDARLRTSNRRVYAAGDVAGGPHFTHVASYHAGIVIRNALFRLPARVDLRALPWVTYTDPELAQVGLTEAQARAAQGKNIRVLRADFADIDRAQTDGATRGFAKLMVTRRRRVLGATIVGRHAGDVLPPCCLAVAGQVKIGALAQAILPYPALGDIVKRAAGGFYTPTLFSRRTRLLVRLLGTFG
jgi:pyruvate/2-oxoglutarate dehydrogenase complex dihydrolipoamide dehydrogenase (E3) component